MKIKIEGQIRSGKNNMQITRTGHHYPRPDWAIWRDEVFWQIKRQVNGHGPICKPCGIEVDYWPGDLKRRDVSGMLDALFHVFEKVGLVKDDSLFQQVTWRTHELDREKPCAVVTFL